MVRVEGILLGPERTTLPPERGDGVVFLVQTLIGFHICSCLCGAGVWWAGVVGVLSVV